MRQQPIRTNLAPVEPAREPLFTANFLLACLVSLATFASFYFLLATLPVYILQIGGTEAEVGLIIGLFATTALLLRPLVGKAADDHGKRLFILAGSAVLFLSSGLYALATTVPLLLALRVLHGAGWGTCSTATSALVADIAPRSRRGEAMGYYGMSNNVAMAVGPALGVLLMTGFSFSVLFLASAAMALVSVLLSLAIREPRVVAMGGQPAGPDQGLIERTALFPSLVLGLMAMTYSSIVSFLPIYASGRGIANPGLFFTAYAIILMLARGFTGQLSDRYGRAAVIAPGLVLAAVGLWLLASAGSLEAFLAVAVLYGLAFAAVHPALMALVVDRAAPNRRGAAIATLSSAMDLGIGGGSFVWGIVAQVAGYSAMYTASSIVALLALALFLAGIRARK